MKSTINPHTTLSGLRTMAMIGLLVACFCGCESDEPGHIDATDDCVDAGRDGHEGAAGCEEYLAPEAKGILPTGLDEISGIALASYPGVLWMHNDSGSGPLLYAVNIESGALVATMTIDVELAYDWEAMSAGPCATAQSGRCLYIGDIGDGGMREFLGLPPQVLRFAEPDPADGDQTITNVETMPLRYPNATPHNAEALVVDAQGRVFILTKEEGNIFLLFGAPFTASETPVELVSYGEFDVSSMRTVDATKVTAADFDPEQNRLIVRGWTGIIEYILPEHLDLTTLVGIVPRVVPGADELQGETVVYGDGGYYFVSEGEGTPIHFVPCGDTAGL